MQKILLIGLILSVAVVQCYTFSKSDHTEIISILNEAAYSSADKSYGDLEKVRVQNRINEIKEQFSQTKVVLQNIEVLQSTENYTIFIKESNKSAYLALKGTVPSQGSDLKNDLLAFFNKSAERFSQINELMKGKITELANQGYSIIVSGHSLGGTLALFACADNSWVSHCEVHNPYLDNNLNKKLKSIFAQKYMNGRVVIQETLKDLVSQQLATVSLGVTYSLFELSQNIKGLNEHNSLSLFAKCFLEGNQTINFDKRQNTASEFMEFVGLCKTKFEEYTKLISSCLISQYYSFSSQSCMASPSSQSFADNFLGTYNCPPSQIPNSNGSCQICPEGTYVSEVGKNTCLQCPPGHKCYSGVKTACPPGTYNPKGNSCLFCNDGYYQVNSGSTECNVCPLGHKCSSKTEEPIACPPGQYNKYLKSTTCYYCDDGQYQTNSGSTECNTCPIGYYCPSKVAEPIACPPGKYNKYLKSTSCQTCDDGTYSLESGSAECKICPAGYKCVSKTELPVFCPEGTYNASPKQTKCSGCNFDYVSNADRTNCVRRQASFLKSILSTEKQIHQTE